MTRTNGCAIIIALHEQMSVSNKKGDGDMNIKLRQMREQKGLTQSELAKRCSISNRAYQNYELGLRTPNVSVAIKIAQVLNTDVKNIFTYAL